jgi:hypothetical protein
MRLRTRIAFPGLARLSVILLLLPLLAGLAARGAVAQDDAATPIGLPDPGETAWEVVGRSDRSDQVIALVGFFSAIAGAEDDLLFTGPDERTEGAARFTFVAELAPGDTAGVGDVRAESVTGTLTVYFASEPGADFADPDSFAAGTPVATFDLRMQDVLSDQSADSTFVDSAGDLIQTGGEPFEHDGSAFAFGRPNAHLLLTLSGVGTGDDVFVLAGYAELTGTASQAGATTGREPEEQATAEATPEDGESTPPRPSDGGEGCDAILPWFETTSDQIADIEVLAEFLLGVESVEDLDAEQLRAAAEALAGLADEQRAVDLPEEAVEARDAIADAMEAIGETVTAVADAVDAADIDAFEEALSDLDAALDDLRAAQADAEELAAEC